MNQYKNTPLTEQQLVRVREAKRLAETKLRNVEETLQRLHGHQEWFRRFNELTHELTEHRNRLNMLNKELASIAKEEQELERFEDFETVQGNFQRLQILEQQGRNNKQQQSETQRELDAIRDITSKNQKELQQAENEYAERRKQMRAILEQTTEAHRMEGAKNILVIEMKRLQDRTTEINLQRDAINKETLELQAEAKLLQDNITQAQTQRQGMEPHQRMAENCELAINLLQQLSQQNSDIEELKKQKQESIKHENEENDLLNRIFTQYQKVTEEIRSLNDELQTHRRTNSGQSSYSLQERAMKLSSRRIALLSAQSLWNRIRKGYLLIEEKTQDTNALRLNIESTKVNIANLEKETAPLRKLCHEKEYTLTLSKSQNVIELRSDLKEGVSCTVCGATHHPYHSDTSLDQNRLISEMRTEYELALKELNEKEKTLQEMRIQLERFTASRSIEEETLSQLRNRQMEDVKEWQVFANLDSSFHECSSSTNLDARATLLQQLIENTIQESEEAQKELDQYNFHQTHINELTEQLSKKEQKREELTTRLNEVNTGCQVMAGRVERLQELLSTAQTRYAAIHEEANKLITLPDWSRDWQSNHEGLIMRIQQLSTNWARINEALNNANTKLFQTQNAIAGNKRMLETLESVLANMRNAMEQQQNLITENERKMTLTIGGTDPRTFFANHMADMQEAIDAKNNQQKEAQKQIEQLNIQEGILSELQRNGADIDNQTREQHNLLDIWIRRFNANHPPVQYNELKQAFAEEKDWNAIRQRVRSIRMEATLEQARVDSLRSSIVSLQAEGHRIPEEGTEQLQASLITQCQSQEELQREIMMQIAMQEITMRNNERLLEELKKDEEQKYTEQAG